MMRMLASELPTQLEVLNIREKATVRVAATLHHLSGESALLTLESSAIVPGLHWGARVRFRLDDGAQSYEVSGMIVALNTGRMVDEAAGEADLSAAPSSEIWVRLWECRAVPQRRTLPRRQSRFPVYYRLPSTKQESPAGAEAASQNETWQKAQCVDIGAGGMRLHIEREVAAQEIELRFTLPACEEPSREFRMSGRILRVSSVKRAASAFEIAVRFARLSVEEGLALSDFLQG